MRRRARMLTPTTLYIFQRCVKSQIKPDNEEVVRYALGIKDKNTIDALIEFNVYIPDTRGNRYIKSLERQGEMELADYLLFGTPGERPKTWAIVPGTSYTDYLLNILKERSMDIEKAIKNHFEEEQKQEADPQEEEEQKKQEETIKRHNERVRFAVWTEAKQKKQEKAIIRKREEEQHENPLEWFKKFKVEYFKQYDNSFFKNVFSHMEHLLGSGKVSTIFQVVEYAKYFPNSRTAEILTIRIKDSAHTPEGTELVRIFKKEYLDKYNASLFKNRNSKMYLDIILGNYISPEKIASHAEENPSSRTMEVLKKSKQLPYPGPCF